MAGVVRPADDSRSACEGAEIVILAASSPTPVTEASWLARATLGPKQQGRAEFGLDLFSLLVTDLLVQIGAYDPPNVLVGTAHERRFVSLGALRAGEAGAADATGVAVFFSGGLAGTEACLLDRLAASIKRRAPGHIG